MHCIELPVQCGFQLVAGNCAIAIAVEGQHEADVLLEFAGRAWRAVGGEPRRRFRIENQR